MTTIQTYSGHLVDVMAPDPAMITIEDIAHHLSLTCRFGGAIRDFYSVAEHSVHVSYLCDPEDALAGLLHDAAEAYVGDIPTPLRSLSPGLNEAEGKILDVIARKWLGRESWTKPESVKRADTRMLSTEARALLHGGPKWSIERPPVDRLLWCVSAHEAKRVFLERFDALTTARDAA